MRAISQAKFALNWTETRSGTCCTQSKLFDRRHRAANKFDNANLPPTSPTCLRQSDLSCTCHRIDPSQSWLLESQCAHTNLTAQFVNVSPRTCQLTLHTGTSAFQKARKVSRRGLRTPSPEKIGIPSRYDNCVCANILMAD